MADHSIDITAEICPITFVRARLAIEKIASGETLEIRLKGAEPMRNLPRSFAELGHAVLSLSPAPEAAAGTHLLLVRKA